MCYNTNIENRIMGGIMNKDNKASIFSCIGKILLFIILLPFNIVKSISLGVKKLMGKDINSENEKVDLSKNVIDEEIKNDKKQRIARAGMKLLKILEKVGEFENE